MEYDINKIRNLCDRYFDGNITDEEEITLKSWFLHTDDIPADLKAVKTMFCGFEEAAEMTYSPSAPEKKTYRTFSRIFWGTVAAAAAAAGVRSPTRSCRRSGSWPMCGSASARSH